MNIKQLSFVPNIGFLSKADSGALRAAGLIVALLFTQTAFAADAGSAEELFQQAKAASNEVEGCKLFGQAAKLGHFEAGYKYAGCFRSGPYEKDYKKAAEILQPGAKAGYYESIVGLAYLYFAGGPGLKQNCSKAVETAQLEATENAWEPPQMLARIYDEGCGEIKPDRAKALAAWRVAAAKGGLRAKGEVAERTVDEEKRNVYNKTSKMLRDLNFKQTRDETGEADDYADFAGTYQGYNITVKIHAYKTGVKYSGRYMGPALTMSASANNDQLVKELLVQLRDKLVSTIGEASYDALYFEIPQFNYTN